MRNDVDLKTRGGVIGDYGVHRSAHIWDITGSGARITAPAYSPRKQFTTMILVQELQ